MASNKKPSIYSDRSTIGSSDELDEYGVWVKSEPQNFSSGMASKAGAEADDAASLSDFDSGLDLPDLDIPDDSLSVSGGTDTFDGFESDTLDDTSLEDTSFDDFSIPEDDTVMNANIDLEDSIGLDDVDGNIEMEDSGALDDSISLDDNIDLEDSIGLDDNLEDNIELDDGLLDDSIGFDDSLEAGNDLDESVELDFPSVEDADDSVLDSGEETPFEDAGFTEIDMDDFMDESPAELPAAGAAHTQTAHTQSDLSTQLLMKIADELSSIKTELTSLKKEFAGLKAEASSEEKEKTDSQHGGFFNEEEDEKIALTGDELDNILTTANFTEEAGEDATEELESDFSFPEVEDDASSVPFQVSDESATGFESLTDEAGIPDILSDQDDIIGIDDKIDDIGDKIDDIGDKIDDIGDKIDDIGDIGDKIEEEIDISVEGDELILDQVDNFTPAFDNTDLKDAEYIEETEDAFDLPPEDVGDIAIADIENIDSAFAADSEELQELRENGAIPMTPAPEDTSYLDEGALSDSDVDISLELPPEDSVPDIASDDFMDIQPDDSFEIEIEESEPEIQEEDFSIPSSEEFFDEQPLDISLEETSEEPLIGISQADIDKLDHSSDINEIPSVADEGDSLDQVIPEGFVVSDDDEAPAPFDDDLEMEEVEALEDIGFNETEELVSGEALDASADSTGIKSAEYPDSGAAIPVGIKSELKIVLSYMDQLLESLPEEKIEEFAKSEYFDTYKKLFKELGLA